MFELQTLCGRICTFTLYTQDDFPTLNQAVTGLVGAFVGAGIVGGIIGTSATTTIDNQYHKHQSGNDYLERIFELISMLRPGGMVGALLVKRINLKTVKENKKKGIVRLRTEVTT